jgi:hypothetical protein
MLEILVERGIGATRALVIEAGIVIEAHFERDDGGPAAGTIHVARLAKILQPGRRGVMRLGDDEGLIEPLPYCAEGGLLRVEVIRAAIPEAGRPRLAKLRNIEGDSGREGRITAGPGLVERLRNVGDITENSAAAIGPDLLEAVGWGETVEMARSGHVRFDGGLLTISPTPAMTVIDIDGPGDAAALAESAAVAVAVAIRRFDITGSIGVDFPTLEGKAVRARLGELLDAHLPSPFERTAINGFGFAQIVRPRLRASFIEQVRAPGFAALELLRAATRGPAGARSLAGPPAVIAWLAARPALVAALARAAGGEVGLRPNPGLAISSVHVG